MSYNFTVTPDSLVFSKTCEEIQLIKFEDVFEDLGEPDGELL